MQGGRSTLSRYSSFFFYNAQMESSSTRITLAPKLGWLTGWLAELEQLICLIREQALLTACSTALNHTKLRSNRNTPIGCVRIYEYFYMSTKCNATNSGFKASKSCGKLAIIPSNQSIHLLAKEHPLLIQFLKV